MIMNLPNLSTEYAWRIENHLTTEDLDRNEVRVALVTAKPTPILRRRRVLMSKTIHIKNATVRGEKIEHAARKLLKKFQRAAYIENANRYATYMAAENMRHDRFNQFS